MTTTLQRITIERRPDGRFHLTREMTSANGPTGDQWPCCLDLLDAFDIVTNAFLPDGTARPPASSRANVAATLRRISFAASCVDLDWRWEVHSVSGPPGGHLIRATFQRPDRDSGNVARGAGRWWHIPADASESAIAKAAYAAARMVLEHEVMEAFHFDHVRIFDPHHDVDDLRAAVEHAAAKAP